jgi:protein-S-isoprenylcysteine O-methyltransferase Ste14
MISEKLVDMLVESSQKPRSWRYKLVGMAFGTLTFLVFLPGSLFLAGYAMGKYIPSDVWRQAEVIFSIASILVGLLLALWTVLAQVTIGKGTPVPLAPTEKLIVTGPYRLCRNPMKLGVIVYYMGLGTLFGSLRIGILMFLLALVIGSCYHKFIEERELQRRFGREYEEYGARTPFLFPKFWS